MYTINELRRKIITIECGSNFSPFVIENNVIYGNVFGTTPYQITNSHEILAYISNPMLLPNLEKKLPIRCRDAVTNEEFFLEIPYNNTGLKISEREKLEIPNPFQG